MPKLSSPELGSLYEAFTSETMLVSPKPMSSLSLLVLNVSEGCNLACSYCFADRGQYGHGSARWMSLDVARQTFDYVERNYASLGAIKFFGGEPFIRFSLLKGIVDYLKQRPFYSRAMPELIAITNATLITDEIVEWVRENDVRLTVSYDGTPAVNDAHRVYPSGRGSSAFILRGLEKLRPVLANTVIEVVFGPAHLAAGLTMRDVARRLRDDFAPRGVIIHPMLRSKYGTFGYTEEQWADFERQVRVMARDYAYDEIVEAEAQGNVETFAYYLGSLTRSDRADRHCGLGVDTLTVQADGNVLPCYTLAGHREFAMGNVGEASRPAAFADVESLFLNNTKSDNPHCANCDVVEVCHACPGGMLDAAGAIDAPIPTMCENMIGTVEGRLLAFNEIAGRNGFAGLFT